MDTKLTMCKLLGILLFSLTISQTISQGLELDENFNMEWSVVSGRMQQPKCVPIPKNLSLCHNVGYETMRLPNLLEHDTLKEVVEQSDLWSLLIGIRCHPDTQIFLCSLFSPICLDRVVYPCRSLCEGVKTECGDYMLQYGFQWPDMFKCDKFPADDDLCIPGPNRATTSTDDRVCKPCKEADSYEGIVHNACKSDFIVRATIIELDSISKTAEPGEIEVVMGKRKKKFYKRNENIPKRFQKLLAERDAKIYIKQGIGCSCEGRIISGEHHLMGITAEEKYDRMGEKVIRFYAEFITSWKDKGGKGKADVKRALKTMKKNENVCEGGLETLETHKEERNKKKAKRDKRKQRKRQRKRL